MTNKRALVKAGKKQQATASKAFSMRTKKQPLTRKFSHHDLFFKQGFSDPCFAKEIFQLVLSPKEFSAFDWESLKAEKDSFQNLRADLVFSVNLKGKSGEKALLCLLLEHKSQYSYKIFSQTLKYQTLITAKTLEETGEAWPVLVCLCYNGKKPWKGEKSFQKGLFGKGLSKIPSSLRKDMLDFKIRLFDIHDPRLKKVLKDESFKSRGFLNGLKEIWSLKAEEEDLREFIFRFDNWTGPSEDLILIVGDYLWSGVAGMTKELWDKLEMAAVKRGIFPKGGYMNVREYIREEGREEGLQKGLQKGLLKGREEGREEIILNMLQAKTDISFISKVTGFSKEEIKKFEKSRQTSKPSD